MEEFIIFAIVVLLISWIIFQLQKKEAKKQEIEQRIERRKKTALAKTAREKAETYTKGNFSVRIEPCVKREDNIFFLNHNTKYKIVLGNNLGRRANTTIFIDGKHIGTFRLPENSKGSLERPANDNSCFTFYKLGSSQAIDSGLSTDNEDIGKIHCVFIPEKKTDIRFSFIDIQYSEEELRNPDKMHLGGTGFSGHSNQKFGKAPEMELDFDRKEEITIQLLCIDNNEKPHKLRTTSKVKSEVKTSKSDETESELCLRIAILRVIKTMIIPAFEKPNEFVYFLLAMTRRLLFQKKYPIHVIDSILEKVIKDLEIKDLSMDIFAQRDNFYYKLQKENSGKFNQYTFDIVKASQYKNLEVEIDMFDVRSILLDATMNGDLGILDDFDLHTKFTAAFNNAIKCLNEIIKDYNNE